MSDYGAKRSFVKQKKTRPRSHRQKSGKRAWHVLRLIRLFREESG